MPRLSLVPILETLQAQQSKLVALFLLTLLIWTGYGFFSRATFFIYTAEIHGNEAVSIQEIYHAAQIDTKSIFWIDPARIAGNITALPNIKTAEVAIALPAKVSIAVTEHRPELLWQTGESVWWVDRDGVVVPLRDDEETADMLRIVDNDQQPLESGYQIDPTIIKGAQTLQLLVPDLAEIQHSRRHGLTVATPEGWPVYLGDGREIRRKLVALTAVLAHLETEGIEPIRINVHDPLRPFYKEEVAPAPAAQLSPQSIQPVQPQLTQPHQPQPIQPPTQFNQPPSYSGQQWSQNPVNPYQTLPPALSN